MVHNDLIFRSALLEELSKGTIITDDLYGMGIMAGNDHAIKKIKEAPAVDAVEVVRCWECKHRESRDCPMCHEVYYYDEDDGGDYYVIDRAVDPNGFCCAGERRDDR